MSEALTQSWYMVGRQTRNLLREPIWIAMMLVQPMFWLLLYSQLFQRIVDLPGFETASYIDFLAPAVVVMTAFFQGTWSGMGMIYDLDRRVIERFLATPARRASLVLSQVIRSGITSLIQGLIILLVALPLGATNGGAPGWLVILLAGGLISAGFAGISQGLALLTRKEASMIGVANFIGLPLMFVSSMLIAKELMPGWMRTASTYNPVEWAVRAAREPVLAAPAWDAVGLYLVLLVAFCAATTAFATWCFRAYERTL
jgi:ABC-2 type transport system permease protein